MNRKMILSQSNHCVVKIETLMKHIFVLLKIEIWEWKYENLDETYFRSFKN